MVIRRIGVASAAKLAGCIYAVIGLIVGLCFALISMVSAGFMAAAAHDSNMPSWFGAMFGVGAVIFAPIFYGIMGVVIGALTAAVYNLVAGVTGGLEIETVARIDVRAGGPEAITAG